VSFGFGAYAIPPGTKSRRLQQGFMPDGMGSDRHFAQQQSAGPNVRFVPLTDIGTPRRSGVHQIDRTKKIHLADVDAIVSEDGIGHRDVEKSVRDCHLQQVILPVDDLAGCPG